MKTRKPMMYWNQDASVLAQTYPESDANTAGGYIRVSRNNKIVYLHRWLWEQLVGPIPHGYTVDHINGIPTDNRLDNLRAVPVRTNLRNSKKRTDNKSGVAGVSRWSAGNAWRASIHDPVTLKQKFTTFSITKYGEQTAFELACKAREEAMNAFVKAGIYTDRHGH